MLPFTLLCFVYVPFCIFCDIQGGLMISDEKWYPYHHHGFYFHHFQVSNNPLSPPPSAVLCGLGVWVICWSFVPYYGVFMFPSCYYAPPHIIVLHSEE